MNAPLRKPMSLEEFLDWEQRQELRYEFDGFAPVAMTGGTFEHAIIQANLIRALGNRLHGRPCRVVGFERVGDDWVGHVLESPAALPMLEIGIELPLPEIYEGVQFPETLEDD